MVRGQREAFVQEVSLRAERPCGWGMLTLMVTMILLGGKEMGSDCMISRKWLVSLIYEGRDLTISWRLVSIYSETYSVGEKEEDTMGWTLDRI